MIIGAIGGGLILFIWQFISWGAVGIHQSQMAHTDKQDAVLEAIAATGLEEGDYFIPQPAPDATAEETESYATERAGKPWAMVKYRKAMSMSMGMNMVRAFIIDCLAVFLLCWLLLQMSNHDMKASVMASVAIGLIGYFSVSYLNSLWFEGNTIPDLIDAFVSWGLVGAFLGWWLNRE